MDLTPGHYNLSPSHAVLSSDLHEKKTEGHCVKETQEPFPAHINVLIFNLLNHSNKTVLSWVLYAMPSNNIPTFK